MKNATETVEQFFLKMNNLKAFLKSFWNSESLTGKIILATFFPVFAFVATLEYIIAKITGTTYNVVNIIVYYMVIPLSWTIMIDYITKIPFLTLILVSAWITFCWKDKMEFRNRCDWAFKKSVDFLLWFKAVGWNYIISSVIICVIIPILVYVELIYAIMKLE
jgi:hypothetical protein